MKYRLLMGRYFNKRKGFVMAESIKAIVGLGNPGREHYFNRHSIGFRVIDALAQRYGGQWRSREDMEIADVSINNYKILLIKPTTFMNSSGRIIPWLAKQGIKPENMLVVHDELEMPFGKLAIRPQGSARGHNGLRSLIAACGEQFHRLRFGIGRPERKEDVAEYVLHDFAEDPAEVDKLIEQAVDLIEAFIA